LIVLGLIWAKISRGKKEYLERAGRIVLQRFEFFVFTVVGVLALDSVAGFQFQWHFIAEYSSGC
jgi:hypothetical protein